MLFALFSAGVAIGVPAGAAETPPEAIRATIEALSKALAGGQRPSIKALADNSFRMVEDGVEYDMEAALSSIKAALQSGTVVRTTHDFTISTEGPVAWAVYHVDGGFSDAHGSFAFHRIETAVLVRGDGGWKVSLLTSVPEAIVPPPSSR
jgi:ketosteroid isomerase-like protein